MPGTGLSDASDPDASRDGIGKTAATRRFTIHVTASAAGGFTGRCLELPAAISEGQTREELESNMREVILLVLETIREESKPDQQIIIDVPN